MSKLEKSQMVFQQGYDPDLAGEILVCPKILSQISFIVIVTRNQFIFFLILLIT